VRSGRPNQDACEHGTGAPGDSLKAVLAVSDGHGGSRHFRSEIGSRLAAHIAVAVVQESIPGQLSDSNASLPDEAVPMLTREIVEDWRSAVLSDLEQHPFTPEELSKLEESDGSDARVSVEEDPVLAYGSTLLVVAAARTFILYLQLGDGDILAVDASGKTYRPLPHDERLVGNQTTSLCQPESWNEFRTRVDRNPDEFASMVLASTDGYSNSFRSEEDFLTIGRDYLNLVREDGLDVLSEELPKILSEASEKGSGDDITLSLLVGDSAYAVPPVVAEAVATEAVAETSAEPAKSPAAEQPARAASKGAAPGERRPRLSAAQGWLLVSLGIILLAAFLFQHFAHKKPQAESSGSTPITAPGAAPSKRGGNAPPQGKEWVLNAGGSSIPLRPRSKVSARQLFGQGSKEDSATYAEVTSDDEGVLRLVNLSDDPWAVEHPGKKTEPPLENGAGVILGSGIKINFGHGKMATIALADEPSEH
jgi:hypothetical protein